jgi:6-pyruvoyltetrahydropterin/6-carboxytetrahydropterin synthase
MYEVSVEETFAAGHALRGYRGKCEKVHGHNYRVLGVIQGERLDSNGLLVDFVELKRILHAIVERLDHVFLNDLPPFDQLNPTAENMARFFYEQLSQGVAGLAPENPVRVAEVKIWETDTATATYRLP